MKLHFVLLYLLAFSSVAEKKLSFNEDIRPILADRCYHCHGPDEKKGQKGGLRLDDEASAKADLYALKRKKKGLTPLSPDKAAEKAKYAIVPGHPEKSLVAKLIMTDDEDDVMPPADSNLKLTAEEKQKLIQWIKEGAEWEKHWAFTKVEKPRIPKENTSWSTGDIDKFVFSKMKKEDLSPAAPAAKEKQLRRLSLVLRGEPPSLAEMDEFLTDKSSSAYEKFVDRYLADSATGERLAVEWLDVARYGDSAGLFEDSFRSVWPWRDWVVKAFNQNKPFNEFITEQVAGDLLPESTLEQKVATGFYRNNPTSNEGGIIDEEYLHLYAADRVKTTGIAFLGMSMECCQCHDHKYDPLSQKEFYELSTFFRSIAEKGRQFSTAAPVIEVPTAEQKRELEKLKVEIAGADKKIKELEKSASGWTSGFENLKEVKISLAGKRKSLIINEINFTGNSEKPQVKGSKGAKKVELLIDGKPQTVFEFKSNNPSLTLTFKNPAHFKSLQIDLSKNPKAFKGAVIEFKTAKGKSAGRETVISVQKLHTFKSRSPEVLKLQQSSTALNKKLKKLEAEIPKTMVMQDLPKPRVTHILDRGDYEKKLDVVQPGVPKAILEFSDKLPKNRLGLAKWLTDKKNPLTARVIINRYWQLVFGRGIVGTAEDFGLQGELPTHPELLDWLAAEFIESNWNLKHMLKLMVMSRTFRQDSSISKEKLAKDKDNLYLSRSTGYRLQAEFIRDNALVISGLLVKEIGGPPVKSYQPPGLWKEKTTKMPFVQDHGEKLYRKTLYSFWRRTSPHPSSVIFDATDRTTCIARRRNTNTPLQALVLLNDVQYVEAARVFAENMLLKGGKSLKDKINTAWRKATGRNAKQEELTILIEEYNRRLSFFKGNPEAAKLKLNVGEFRQNKQLNPVEHAAFMAVTQIILNLNETITLN